MILITQEMVAKEALTQYLSKNAIEPGRGKSLVVQTASTDDITDQDFLLSMSSFSKRYIKPLVYKTKYKYKTDEMNLPAGLLVSFALSLPTGLDMAVEVEHNSVKLRFLRGFDITTNKYISRFDILRWSNE